MMHIYWQGTSESYKIQRKNPNDENWVTIAENIPNTHYYDPDGTVLSVYRIASTGSDVWTPSIYGTPDSSIGLCKIYGYIYNIDGTPCGYADVFIKRALDVFFLSFPMYTKDTFPIQANESGYWEAFLVRGLKVNIYIPTIDLNVDIVVPDTESCPLATLL